MLAQSDVHSRVATISPAEAASLRERFHSTGKIDQRLLTCYVDNMREGRWVLNGAPIVLSNEGMLLDGRIRMLACIQAGRPFKTLVVEGISATSYETIDATRKRTLADVLEIRNERHGRPLAAGLRIIWTYLNGGVPGLSKPPSPISLLALLEEHPTIRDSVIPALAAMPALPHGCGIALHYLTTRVDAKRGDLFISQLGDPPPAAGPGPVSSLRQALLELKGQGGNRKQTYILAISIKVWNAFSRDSEIKLLRYSPDREGFPRIGKLSLSAGPLFDVNSGPTSAYSHTPQDDASKVLAHIATITPKIASKMLEARQRNRRVSASVINKYARDMAAGRWQLNGQTIKLSTSGALLDGQHRLEAAKKAKKAFQTIIVEGLSEQSFSSLDIGHRRNVSDILRDRGESHTVILASSLRWLWMIRNEVVLAANSSPTNGELLTLLDANQQIRRSLRHVLQMREIMGSGISCALHYVFAQIDDAKADEFFSRLIKGADLSENSPIYHLRERLIRTRSSHRVRLAEAERVALTIKAWNAFRKDRPMQLLVWRNRGSTRESLPKPA